jgi:hypothetical protein
MLTVARLRRKPRHFRTFTGLRIEEFDALLAALEPEYAAIDRARKARPGRQRAIGAGRRFELALAERLLMVLMYTRLYTTELLIGYLFGLDASSVNRERNLRMVPALSAVLPLPAREEMGVVGAAAHPGPGGGKRMRTLEELLQRFPELGEVLIDATEQPVPEPKEKRARRERYSGKQKRHTLKTQATVTPGGAVLHATPHLPGSLHDQQVLRCSGVLHRLRRGMVARLDRGYEAVEGVNPGVTIEKPFKAYRNHRVTALGRAYNQMQSKLRIGVEHTFARLKRFQVLGRTYRGRIANYDALFGVVCGLNNFRVLGRLAW